jgi:glucosamine kinase
MLLIADSGSTKTDWRIIDQDKNIAQAKTAGFNPYYQTEEQIFAELKEVLLPQVKGDITEIYFYGAGCSSPDKNALVENALSRVFLKAQVHVSHDLLAAARALCGSEAGIACILGTGSNSCLYDGKDIVANKASLGYILGDEGSGAVLGKLLVSKYFNRELPGHLMAKFEKRYALSREELLDNVYKKPFPNRYLAKFSQFLFHNLSDPYIYKLVYDAFADFFDKNVLYYENYADYKVHFTGSIAFYYSNILRQVANDKGIVVKNILENPIAGLTLYHIS